MSKHPVETFYIPLLLSIAAALVSSLSELPMWLTVCLYAAAGVLVIVAAVFAYRSRKSENSSGRGGSGGAAESFGNSNDVTGGKGGNANAGRGGAGGNAKVRGNNSVAKGGDGGAG